LRQEEGFVECIFYMLGKATEDRHLNDQSVENMTALLLQLSNVSQDFTKHSEANLLPNGIPRGMDLLWNPERIPLYMTLVVSSEKESIIKSSLETLCVVSSTIKEMSRAFRCSLAQKDHILSLANMFLLRNSSVKLSIAKLLCHLAREDYAIELIRN